MSRNWKAWVYTLVATAAFLAGLHIYHGWMVKAVLVDFWVFLGVGWFAGYSRYRESVLTAHEQRPRRQVAFWIIAEVLVLVLYNLAWPIWALAGEDIFD